MYKKSVEAFIPSAMALIERHMAEDNLEVPKVYKGYISSMGAAMIQSGLLPTLAVFSAPKSDSAGADRRKLMRTLTEMLREVMPNTYGTIPPLDDNPGEDEDRLLRYANLFSGNPGRLRAIRQDVTHASVAIKLALRTFKLVGNL